MSGTALGLMSYGFCMEKPFEGPGGPCSLDSGDTKYMQVTVPRNAGRGKGEALGSHTAAHRYSQLVATSLERPCERVSEQEEGEESLHPPARTAAKARSLCSPWQPVPRPCPPGSFPRAYIACAACGSWQAGVPLAGTSPRIRSHVL